MHKRRIVLLDSAYEDLGRLDDWLSEVASEIVAQRFVDKILARLQSLEDAGSRGTVRTELPGLRVIGLFRNITIAFVVGDNSVVVHRVIYGGQNWQSALTGKNAED